MMKKSIITSLLFLIPAFAAAADHCTNPNEYTIDRRCYVTDEQKTQKPYNAVAFVTSDEVFYEAGQQHKCTGTIVKEKDGKIYLYTAKHCINYVSQEGKEGDFPVSSQPITLQDSTKIRAIPHVIPFKNKERAQGRYGEYDWAVFKFKVEDEEKLKSIATDKSYKKTEPNAKLVGYSSLKIMSDKQISDFKQAFMEHIEKGNISRSGIHIKDNNISYIDMDNQNIIDFINNKYKDLLNDEYFLKVSFCNYSSQKGSDGCQGWSGNSGGPVFDSDGKIMAIVTKGYTSYLDFKADEYARTAEDQKNDKGKLIQKGSIRINDINLSQPEPFQKGTTAVKKTNKK